MCLREQIKFYYLRMFLYTFIQISIYSMFYIYITIKCHDFVFIENTNFVESSINELKTQQQQQQQKKHSNY